jgi:V/A-type H+-transporting ATPase subunit E
MNDVTNEKITALQGIILEHANSQRSAIVAEARREAEAWLRKEITKLERETSAVMADAKQRSEEIHRRLILSAEREKATEALRQQNRFLNEAMKKFQDGLVLLRERSDYVKILSALAINAARSLKSQPPIKLRLAAADSSLGNKIAAEVNARIPGAGMIFESEPAPILGGCIVESADGRRQINADWQSRAQEVSDTLADRLLALL